MFRFLLAACLTLAMLCGAGARAADDFLPPEQAFKFSATMRDAHTVVLTYDIAPGYYMYRERFAFKAAGATLGSPDYPHGKVKFDETFQKDVETYRQSVTITIPVQAAGAFTLSATSQGCADAGLCYSPQQAQAQLSGAGGAPQGSASGSGSGGGAIDSVLGSGKLLAIIPAFLVLGLGLAFTPCVLPMVPILSSIIVGEGTDVKRARGLLLSCAYALGMAVVYTALGVAAGLAGEGLAAALQQPWVLGSFGVLIAIMALSMFNVFQLQLPSALQSRLSSASGQQSGGKLAGVFIMGALSALIVGPCVAAPLAGALVYISQTRNVLIGGSALFAMAVGMSIPLLLVGVSAGSLLPRAGAWMESVKKFFGVIMLGMAIWLVAPVIAPAVQMALWAALLTGYGAYLLLRGTRHWAAMAIGAAFGVLGLIQLAGLATGGRDALAPLAHLRGGHPAGLPFQRIKTVAQLEAALAGSLGKTAMLDFYADWCVSCKEMEKLTFVDARVKAALAGTLLLQVDVTANDADDKALLKRFGLFGPPGIILFDRHGQEIAGARVIGYQNAERFSASLAVLK